LMEEATSSQACSIIVTFLYIHTKYPSQNPSQPHPRLFQPNW
jgi:hypothetical protein